MELVPFIITILLSSLGLPVGILIAKLAKEELDAGRIYFRWLESLILIAVLVLSWKLFAWQIFAFLALIVFLLVVPVWRVLPMFIRMRTSPVPFVLLALILYTTQDSTVFKILVALSFLYGLPAGTMLYIRQEKWWKGLALRMICFVGFSLLFQLLR